MRPNGSHPGKPSDQLPEEAPPGVASDEVPGAGEGAARRSAQDHARRANRSGQRPGDDRESRGGEAGPPRTDA